MLAIKDNLETRGQSRKRGIIQSNIYGNLPKVNQIIYTLDSICVPNIMILAQAVFQIPFQGSTSVVVPYFYLFMLSVFILWFTYYVSDIF